MSNPVFAWLSKFFTALAVVVTAIAAFTGNLQKIIDFLQKNLLQQQAEVSETKLEEKRKKLLNKLKNDIRERIRKSLGGLSQVALEIEEQPHQVGRKPWELAPQDDQNSMSLNPLSWVLNSNNSQNIIEFFERNQGKLLILGEPGGGKTNELLCLAQILIDRAIKDKNAPIPIIFEISTWKDKQSIRDWLIEQLCDIYKAIPKEVAEHWIDNEEIIPLLDGLNELKRDRNNFISLLKEFLESSFQPGLVVCCQ